MCTGEAVQADTSADAFKESTIISLCFMSAPMWASNTSPTADVSSRNSRNGPTDTFLPVTPKDFAVEPSGGITNLDFQSKARFCRLAAVEHWHWVA